jgi:hypothetical protein
MGMMNRIKGSIGDIPYVLFSMNRSLQFDSQNKTIPQEILSFRWLDPELQKNLRFHFWMGFFSRSEWQKTHCNYSDSHRKDVGSRQFYEFSCLHPQSESVGAKKTDFQSNG